ncbi:cytochrome P450 4C1-like isoform X2 [Pseudomyrmex gracilis]|uniref:cytochrome P450 4C1-like isoform X2 n=1 Tax=Pseudomyrmex gracilis TaxID=219809 RepID=UPI000995D101|nr:cytochrome P450 4C1-like isoform X2 [Pseudomyrmex gracilis]XP_020289586.1 cytochrome P450 4C1-like isoform X2 [Pseudomyrmex gracilis]XP_020289587.1 cytochrome P450 4C1-like isoform X2 [Pseudomyrmex gracilis]
MIIITILLLLILYIIIYDFYVHHNRSGRLLRLIPGAPSIPILGSALLFQCSQEEAWHVVRYFTDKIYPITKLWIGPTCNIYLRHPDDLEKVLSSTKHIEKSILYDALRPWLKDGLLTSKGSKWHIRRKLLTPTFHFSLLQQFVEVLIEEGNHMTNFLKESEGTVIKNLVPFLSEHTLNAICETAMGISLRSCDTFQEQYRKSVQDMGDFIVHRYVCPWLHLDWMFTLSPTGRKQAKTLKILHGFTEKVIRERKLYHERTEDRYLKNIKIDLSTADVEVIGLRKKRLAMLDLLIAASRENNITDLDIREEVDTFMFEGHDTTAIGVCFALLLLAEHKDIQDRVRTEVDDVMKEYEGKLTMASLQKLPYLERCLKESLRLYPSVPSISRILAEDIKCQSYIVPANTSVLLGIYSVHRDPHFWSNPDVFDPDRFLPDQMQNRHPYCYLPFSAGPRNCIGQRFGMYEMKAMIAPLVHHFYLEPVDYLRNLKMKIDLILRPAHPVRVKFVPIK